MPLKIKEALYSCFVLVRSHQHCMSIAPALGREHCNSEIVTDYQWDDHNVGHLVTCNGDKTPVYTALNDVVYAKPVQMGTGTYATLMAWSC